MSTAVINGDLQRLADGSVRPQLISSRTQNPIAIWQCEYATRDAVSPPQHISGSGAEFAFWTSLAPNCLGRQEH